MPPVSLRRAVCALITAGGFLAGAPAALSLPLPPAPVTLPPAPVTLPPAPVTLPPPPVTLPPPPVTPPPVNVTPPPVVPTLPGVPGLPGSGSAGSGSGGSAGAGAGATTPTTATNPSVPKANVLSLAFVPGKLMLGPHAARQTRLQLRYRLDRAAGVLLAVGHYVGRKFVVAGLIGVRHAAAGNHLLTLSASIVKKLHAPGQYFAGAAAATAGGWSGPRFAKLAVVAAKRHHHRR